MTDDKQMMAAEAKKKSIGTITTAAIGIVGLGIMLYGVVKFFPISSQVALAIQAISDQAEDIVLLEDHRSEDRAKIDAFQDSEFPVIRTEMQEDIRQLQTALTALDLEVDQTEAVAQQAAHDHVEQKSRATVRIGQHEARDVRMDGIESDSEQADARIIQNYKEADERIISRIKSAEAFIEKQKTDRQDVDILTVKSELDTIKSTVAVMESLIRSLQFELQATGSGSTP